jgi:hypothetical protein
MAGTMSDKRITCLFKSFNKNLNGQPIHKYFNIHTTIFSLIRDDCLSFTFHCLHNETYDISKLALPDDLITHIQLFLPQEIRIQYKIVYSIDYPFKPPIWTTENPVCSKITNMHNSENKYDWSPAMTIEKDTLSMITKLVQLIC